MTPQQIFDNLSYIQSHKIHSYQQEFTFQVHDTIHEEGFYVQIAQPWTNKLFLSIPTMKILIKILGTKFAVYDNHLSWWIR